MHVVGAWASANHLSLGHVATDAKSNESTAIPQLLALLEIKECAAAIVQPGGSSPGRRDSRTATTCLCPGASRSGPLFRPKPRPMGALGLRTAA